MSDNDLQNAEPFDIEADARQKRPDFITPEGEERLVENAVVDPAGYQRKLSLSAICTPELVTMGARAREAEGAPPEGPITMVRVIGILDGLTAPIALPAKQPGELPRTTHGLNGRIEMLNLLTGEVLRAATLYLPEGFHELILDDLQHELDSAGANATVEIAMEFQVIPANNPRGYSWRAKSLMEPRGRDPLARLRARGLLVGSTPKTRQLALPGTASGEQRGETRAK